MRRLIVAALIAAAPLSAAPALADPILPCIAAGGPSWTVFVPLCVIA